MNRVAPWVLIGYVVLGGPATAQAQVKSVALHPPRPFGYFVGDVLHAEVTVTVDRGVDLVAASVPQPGPLNAWLELISSNIEESSAGADKSYRVHLDYQNFYPALDSRSLDVPGFALTFTANGRPVTAQVPPWSFLIAPLREVQPASKASGADYMQPDARPIQIDLRGPRLATFGFLAAAVITLGLLAYRLAWWPFIRRPGRHFAAAARRIRKLLGAGPADAGYCEALLTLHRAIDATAGHAVLADDVPEFIEHAPAFSFLKDEFNAFFRSSRRVFFRGDVARARSEFSADALVRFCDRLVSAERVGR